MEHQDNTEKVLDSNQETQKTYLIKNGYEPWPKVLIELLTDTARMPTRGSEQAAGWDVYVDGLGVEGLVLGPGDRKIISTGISMSLPKGTCYLVCSRSGWAFNKGVLVLNAPGVIDSDFMGELKVLITNTGEGPVWISQGDRVAQILFTYHLSPTFEEVDELPKTSRGTGGFGASGM